MPIRLAKLLFLIISLLFIGNITHLFCQSDEYLFSHFSSGLGARALGMGKAYLAISDDSFASSWNPAGLAELSQPEFSLSFSYLHSTNTIPDYRYEGIQLGYPISYEVSNSNVASYGQYFDFLGLAYPFRILGRNVVTQLSYQRKVPFSLTQKYEYKFEYLSRYRYDYDYNLKSAGEGGYDVISLTLASEIFKNFRVGVVISRWFNGFSLPIEEAYAYSVENYYGLTADWNESLDDTLQFEISGYSFSAGLLYRISDKINLGFVYNSRFQGNLDYSNEAQFYNSYDGASLSGSYSGSGEIYLPPAFGAGIALDLTPNLLLSFDYMKTLWSKGKIRDYARANGSGGVPSIEEVLYPTMKSPDLYEQLDTQHYAAGLEYRAKIKKITFPLRAGLFYDLQYSLDSENIQKGYFGISFGSGYRWRNLNLDLALIRYSCKFKYLHDYLEIYYGYIRSARTNMILLQATVSCRF